MKRYTEKVANKIYSTTNYLIKDILNIDVNNPDGEYIRRTQKAVIHALTNKLGELEDLMEKYDIRDIKELEEIIVDGMAIGAKLEIKEAL